MRVGFFIACVNVCLLILSAAGAKNLYAQKADADYLKADSSFSKEILKRYLEFLGSDLFEGRGNGEIGGSLAAKYLALEFDKLNLKPAGSNNTYYQYVPMHGSKPLQGSQLEISSGDSSTELKLNDDYLLYNSVEQTYIPNPIPLVFVGYGIIAPEYDYNDYQSVNVEGKIVVFLEGEPYSTDEKFFEGEKPTIFSYAESKQRLALSRGARGSIMIPNTNIPGHVQWDHYQKIFSFEHVTLAYSVTGNLSVLMNPEAAKKLFNNSPYSLQDVFNMQAKNKIISFPLSTKLSFKGRFKERDFISSNVIGMVEGSDPKLKDTYLIVSAHYDHLGIGPAIKGDSVYNGVLDNAAGCAALLELANAFSKLSPAPKRSIIFLLDTGEEKGLLGTRYYTDHPAVPLYKTIANVNIDGLAVLDKFKSIIPVGDEYSTLGNFVKKVADEMNLSIEGIPPQFSQAEAFNESDQVTFAMAGIPSLLLLDGLKYEHISTEEGLEKIIHYSTQLYHSPFDDLSQDIDYDASIEHIKILFRLCYELANSDTAPEWKKGSPFINARLRSIAEKR